MCDERGMTKNPPAELTVCDLTTGEVAVVKHPNQKSFSSVGLRPCPELGELHFPNWGHSKFAWSQCRERADRKFGMLKNDPAQGG